METRNSHGLDQFCASLDERTGLSIVDFAGVNQSTVSYVTNLEHRLYSDDFVYQLDECFGSGDAFFENQSDPKRVARFLESTAGCLNQQFDGALVWDGLQYLTQPLLESVIVRLHTVLRPGSYLLAVFSSNETSAEVPTYSYRIGDHRTLQLVPKGPRKAAQPFNNRSLEKLFHNFHSVKFFLTRDHLREVIVRR
ncbi:MAG: hypothetical protein ABI824_09055 [Acidobacteriota bacterium]